MPKFILKLDQYPAFYMYAHSQDEADTLVADGLVDVTNDPDAQREAEALLGPFNEDANMNAEAALMQEAVDQAMASGEVVEILPGITIVPAGQLVDFLADAVSNQNESLPRVEIAPQPDIVYSDGSSATFKLANETCPPDEPRSNWYFTFGFGHAHANGYVKIHGTYSEARAEMNRRYGGRWAFQYDERSFAEQPEQYGLRLVEAQADPDPGNIKAAIEELRGATPAPILEGIHPCFNGHPNVDCNCRSASGCGIIASDSEGGTHD